MAEVGVSLNDDENQLEENVVNFYFVASMDSKNGTGVRGGQIPCILFYA